MKFKIVNNRHPVYGIMAEGIIYHVSIGEGRPIPIVLIDVPIRSEVDDLLEIHYGLLGDATLTWTKPFGLSYLFDNHTILLTFEFSKPMRIVFTISFDFRYQYGIILGILESRAVYLQRGEPGDKASTADRNRVMVEIPDMGFEPLFYKKLRTLRIKTYRKNGLSKAEAMQATENEIRDRQAMYRHRMTAAELEAKKDESGDDYRVI